MNIGMILKIVSHLGSISKAGSDFEQACKDLFAGKLTESEVATLLSDIESILEAGFIPLPDGIDGGAINGAFAAGEALAHDVIQSIKDIEEKGISAVLPDIKKIASDVLAYITSKPIVLKNFSLSTAQEVLQDIIQGL